MSTEELTAIAALRNLPTSEKLKEAATKRVLAPLGAPLPIIHQVLFHK